MNQLNFTPFPVITNERLLLRSLNPDDVNEILFLRSDERILKYLDIPIAKTINDAKKFINKINDNIINNLCIYWGIAGKNKTKLIGTICLWNFSEDNLTAFIGYVLHPDFQGKGIMQEALINIINYGFKNLKLKSIEADVDPDNSKSINLLKKNNFILKERCEKTLIYTLVDK